MLSDHLPSCDCLKKWWLMKFPRFTSLLGLLIFTAISSRFAFAVSSDVEEFKVKVTVQRVDDQFNVEATYQTPLNACQAYRYLTDYEAAKHIPGVVESKVTRQSPNRVLVERTADETILLFRVRLSSQIEYIEHPYSGTDFHQVKGDSKVFKGKWSTQANDEGTLFHYQGVVVLESVFPMFVVEYFIKNSIKDRFAVMARMAKDRKDLQVAQCDATVVKR
jgi:hypothetical protein